VIAAIFTTPDGGSRRRDTASLFVLTRPVTDWPKGAPVVGIGARDLEVHVAVVVFRARDVGEDGPPAGLFIHH
jgi:hypothetical protein